MDHGFQFLLMFLWWETCANRFFGWVGVHLHSQHTSSRLTLMFVLFLVCWWLVMAWFVLDEVSLLKTRKPMKRFMSLLHLPFHWRTLRIWYSHGISILQCVPDMSRQFCVDIATMQMQCNNGIVWNGARPELFQTATVADEALRHTNFNYNTLQHIDVVYVWSVRNESINLVLWVCLGFWLRATCDGSGCTLTDTNKGKSLHEFQFEPAKSSSQKPQQICFHGEIDEIPLSKFPWNRFPSHGILRNIPWKL